MKGICLLFNLAICDMKFKFVYFSAWVFILALVGCTQEKIVYVEKGEANLKEGEDVLELSLSNMVSTRAARPIGSSEADNNVNRVAFKFINSGGTELSSVMIEGVIDDKGNEDGDYDVSTDGKVLSLPSSYAGTKIKIKFSGLEGGSYKILAYGYNCGEGNTTFPYTIEIKNDGEDVNQRPDLASGSPAVLAYSNSSTSSVVVEEIFAGQAPAGQNYIGINDHGKFESVPEIVLKRQVAGLMAYMTDAPVYVGTTKVEKITVSTKYSFKGFYFPASMLDDSGYNGIGTASTSWVNLLTFDMKSASNYSNSNLVPGDHYEFMKGKTGDGTNYLLANENAAGIDGLWCQDNTLFGSCFLFAFYGNIDLSVSSYGVGTLNICYWDSSDALIKSVPLRNGGNAETSLSDANVYQFDIKCNHFYSIGTKNQVGKPDDDPDNPDVPDPDDDNPLPVDEESGYDYGLFSIDDTWDGTIGLEK